MVITRQVATLAAAALLGAGAPAAVAAQTQHSSLPAGEKAVAVNPVVVGPVKGGIHGAPFFASLYPMAANGYVEEEYFISGTAHSISKNVDAPYETRILVRRPANPAHFNGTLLTEWVNVTGTSDLEAIYPAVGKKVITDGYAWATVSAQLVGVCCGPLSLKAWDPIRYAPLVHPGDEFAMDIYEQALQSLVHPEHNRYTSTSTMRIDPMEGLKVRRHITSGASQSAGQLTTYINDGYPIRGLIDGFLITRGGGPYRKTFRTPTIQLVEENQNRPQPDSSNYRYWTEAGIAHAPADWYDYVWTAYQRDTGTPPLAQPLTAGCSMNRGTSNYTHRAALEALQRWLTHGTRAPAGSDIRHDGSGAIVRDPDGLAMGGIRLPFIDVPLATETSSGCPLFGTHTPWSSSKIINLYPTHAAYVAKIDRSVSRLVRAGFLLGPDAAAVRAQADALDLWTEGSCWDTAAAGSDERGPVTGQTRGLAYSGAQATTHLHEANCAAAQRGL